MPSPASQVEPTFCVERQRLIDAFTTAVSIYLRVQSAQSQALIEGRGFEFEADIIRARKERDNAKAAIIKHQREHGC